VAKAARTVQLLGELDQDHPDVLDHRHQQVTQLVGVPGGASRDIGAEEVADGIHATGAGEQPRHRRRQVEGVDDRFAGGADRRAQERRDQRVGIEAEMREDRRRREAGVDQRGVAELLGELRCLLQGIAEQHALLRRALSCELVERVARRCLHGGHAVDPSSLSGFGDGREGKQLRGKLRRRSRRVAVATCREGPREVSEIRFSAAAQSALDQS
jgi:hypothetical protein